MIDLCYGHQLSELGDPFGVENGSKNINTVNLSCCTEDAKKRVRGASQRCRKLIALPCCTWEQKVNLLSCFYKV